MLSYIRIGRFKMSINDRSKTDAHVGLMFWFSGSEMPLKTKCARPAQYLLCMHKRFFCVYTRDLHFKKASFFDGFGSCLSSVFQHFQFYTQIGFGLKRNHDRPFVIFVIPLHRTCDAHLFHLLFLILTNIQQVSRFFTC